MRLSGLITFFFFGTIAPSVVLVLSFLLIFFSGKRYRPASAVGFLSEEHVPNVKWHYAFLHTKKKQGEERERSSNKPKIHNPETKAYIEEKIAGMRFRRISFPKIAFTLFNSPSSTTKIKHRWISPLLMDVNHDMPTLSGIGRIEWRYIYVWTKEREGNKTGWLSNESRKC